MKFPFRGAGIILTAIVLAGCAGPMNQREAQSYAASSIREYCAETSPCGVLRVTRAQRLGDGWMVDFEDPGTTYGVLVHPNGTTQVTAWKKQSGTAAR